MLPTHATSKAYFECKTLWTQGMFFSTPVNNYDTFPSVNIAVPITGKKRRFLQLNFLHREEIIENLFTITNVISSYNSALTI